MVTGAGQKSRACGFPDLREGHPGVVGDQTLLGCRKLGTEHSWWRQGGIESLERRGQLRSDRPPSNPRGVPVQTAPGPKGQTAAADGNGGARLGILGNYSAETMLVQDGG